MLLVFKENLKKYDVIFSLTDKGFKKKNTVSTVKEVLGKQAPLYATDKVI